MSARNGRPATRKARRREARESARQATHQPRPVWQRAGRWIWWLAIPLIVLAGVAIIRYRQVSQAPATASQLAVGSPAPTGDFTDLKGRAVTLASLRGQPTLLWFITTWCSSCQAGTQAMAQQINRLRADGVRVQELELYNNLGGSGPDMNSFRRTYAGKAMHSPDWHWGLASRSLSYSYDPKGYLDIYYLLDSQGHIRYINGSPASTMGPLLQAAAQLSP